MQKTTYSQNSNLYRQEAIDSFINKELGRVAICPRNTHIISFFAYSMLFLLCAYFIFTQPIYKTSVLPGWIESDIKATSIHNKEAGSKVLEVLVRNGEKVSQDQLIAKLVRPFASMLSDKQISEKLMLIEQKRIQNTLVLKKQLEKTSLSINTLNLDLSANEKRIQLIKQQQKEHLLLSQTTVELHESMQILAEKALMAKQEMANSQLRVQNIANQGFDISIALENLIAQNTQIKQNIEQHKLDISRLKESIKLVNIESDEQVIDFKQTINIDVFSPTNGIVENLNLQKGDTLSNNQMLAHIRPKISKHIVKLAIPSNMISHLNSESFIKVQVDGYPFQQFGSLSGKIVYVDKTLMLPQHLTDKPISIAAPVYIANVEVSANHSISLLAGVSVSASVGMKQMTIFQWLIQPIAKSLFLQFGEIKE